MMAPPFSLATILAPWKRHGSTAPPMKFRVMVSWMACGARSKKPVSAPVIADLRFPPALLSRTSIPPKSAAAGTSLRAAANMRSTVYSAMVTAFTPGVLVTTIPRSVAWRTSTLL